MLNDSYIQTNIAMVTIANAGILIKKNCLTKFNFVTFPSHSSKILLKISKGNQQNIRTVALL